MGPGGQALAGVDVDHIETPQPGVVPDVVQRPPGAADGRGGSGAPAVGARSQQYAMIENALRGAEGRTLAGHRSEIARLWGASTWWPGKPPGRLPQPPVGRRLDTPSAANRPLAFPYNKWHASQWTVDQAAALVLCSVEAARAVWGAPRPVGVPVGRCGVQPRGLAQSRRKGPPPLAGHGRARERRWPSGSGGRWPRLEVMEVYSAFPRRSRSNNGRLGLGPSMVADGDRGHDLRRRPVQQLRLPGHGGGGRTAPGRARGSGGRHHRQRAARPSPECGAWSTRPDGRPPLVGDLASEVPVGHRHGRRGRDAREL